MAEPTRLVPIADSLAPADGRMIACRKCDMPTQIPIERYLATKWEHQLCRHCLDARDQAQRNKRAYNASALLRAAGVMPEHLDAKLGDFDATIASDARWPIGLGLVINGKWGRGKTHLAAAVARNAIVAGESVVWGMSREILRRIRDTYNAGATETESKVIAHLCDAGLLVIDDLGPDREGRATEHVLGILHEVLSKRIGFGRPTVITTNLPTAGIEETYGGAIMSRLRLMRTVTLIGPDWRQLPNGQMPRNGATKA